MLSIQHATVSQGQQTLISALHLQITAGEVVTLMGPSGVGKSTLLNWIIGALPAAFQASGEIWLNERRIDTLPTEQRRVGILFQDDLLFPHLSVGDNLAFALPAQVRGKQARQGRINQVLNRADLSGFYHRDPATLSGGQRARISVLRALLAEPQAILLDEPFSRLDAALRTSFRDFVYQQIHEQQIPALLVTHDRNDIPASGKVHELAPHLSAQSTFGGSDHV